jgi:hypothetical protein
LLLRSMKVILPFFFVDAAGFFFVIVCSDNMY